MGRANYYKSGDYNGICEVCGQKYKFSQLRQRWDGVMVCFKDWEPRHPQEFIRGVKDNPSVPISRPEATDTFQPYCLTTSAISGYAQSGCSISGNNLIPYYLLGV